MMREYAFTIIASGLDPEADDFEDRFFEAGCSDASISYQKGLIIVEFTRAAKNFSHAVTSALADVQKAGAAVERFEPDYLVSLSEIASRSGLSKAAISLYGKGERGEGFPSPVARVTSEHPLWDWVEVSRWLQKQNRLSADIVLEARILRDANYITKMQGVRIDQFGKLLEDRIRAYEAA
jgi:hypothetical protein